MQGTPEQNNELEMLLKKAAELEKLKPGAIFVVDCCVTTLLASERLKQQEAAACG